MAGPARFTVAAVLLTALAWGPPADAKPGPKAFTAEELDKAEFKSGALRRSRPSALALKLQVLLDCAHVSPGAIDGVYGASAAEGLAEKFHMNEALLTVLNPGKSFDKAGETIKVIDPGGRMDQPVERIEIDARENVLRAFGAENRVLAAYPATVGSRDSPSPSGSLKVRAVADNPTYYYDPKKLNFPNVKTDGKLKIAAGPNNPVGAVWIDLDKETYGIHGTPDPAEIGKESSNGCVRLTNWDVEELAPLVKKGTPVEFVNVMAAR